MARTKTWPDLRPSATGDRPTPIPFQSIADLGHVCAVPLDEQSMILVPAEGYAFNEQGEIPEDAECFHADLSRCWQATVAYERFGRKRHPNLLPFLHRDPWTAFPVLSTPPGKPLHHFLSEKKHTMYTAPPDTLSTRVLPEHRPLVYQWALDLISALSFIHSEDVVFGNLGLENCWVSMQQQMTRGPSLSVFGFVDARFRNRPEEGSIDAGEARGFVGWMAGRGGYAYPGSWDYSVYYDWSRRKRDDSPTERTDLFLYGCVLYEVMLGIGAGAPVRSEVARKIRGREWPRLETEYMGEIVRRCWRGEFASADEVKVEVERFVRRYGDGDLR